MGRHKIFGGDSPCKDCGTDENIIWHTDNVFWNMVMDNEDDHVFGDERGSILCVHCFVKRAEQKFDIRSWKLEPNYVDFIK